MKQKIVKLTESDVEKLVSKIIKESDEQNNKSYFMIDDILDSTSDMIEDILYDIDMSDRESPSRSGLAILWLERINDAVYKNDPMSYGYIPSVREYEKIKPLMHKALMNYLEDTYGY